MEYPNENQSRMTQANWFVNYYETLASREGEEAKAWILGYFMAKNWLRLLGEKQVNLEEAKLFLKVLEAEKLNQGSGWYDLSVRVKFWIEEIEHSGKTNV